MHLYSVITIHWEVTRECRMFPALRTLSLWQPCEVVQALAGAAFDKVGSYEQRDLPIWLNFCEKVFRFICNIGIPIGLQLNCCLTLLRHQHT